MIIVEQQRLCKFVDSNLPKPMAKQVKPNLTEFNFVRPINF